MSKLKGLTAEIYRAKGYESRMNTLNDYNRVTVIDKEIDEIFTANKDAPAVRLVRRNLSGGEYIHAVPYGCPDGSTMFGGSFIYCSDSRLRNLNKYPIPLHDRIE